MTAIRYVASRTIRSDHSAGTQYEVDVLTRDLDRQVKPQAHASQAMDGTTEGVLEKMHVYWHVTTAPLTGAWAQLLQEFLDSTVNSETWELDPYGSAGDSPGDMRAVVREAPAGYRERRRVRKGDGGGSDYFAFTFVAREL